MALEIRSLKHYYSRDEKGYISFEISEERSCVKIAEKLLRAVFEAERSAGRSGSFSHFFVTTSSPDRLAPSLSHTLQAIFPEYLGNIPTYDLIQGCTSSVTGLTLAAEVTSLKKTKSIFLAIDVASQSVNKSSNIFSGFSDGGFACVLEESDSGGCTLLKTQIRQYPEVTDVVTVELGLRTRKFLQEQRDSIYNIENKIGLNLDKKKAILLAKHAKKFSDIFFSDQQKPEYVILHQANSEFLKRVRKTVFPSVENFFELSEVIGNCGTATIGVLLSLHWRKLQGKRCFLCSFGTGGVISAAYWLF